MDCPYCKAENRDGVRYCGSCGKFIGSTTLSNPPTLTPNSTANASRSLVPGSRLQGGRYVIKKVLGQGGMGAALLATDLRLDSKPVVIKELISDNVDPIKQQEDVRNFKREVALLAHIDHPLVPNVTDHFQEGTRYFMVQEFVDGENLEDFLSRTSQPMREREALICASELLDILDYLAQQTPPIVHRDIKPANIIIGTRDKRAHLVDFGIARAEVARNAQRKQTSALGTPGYAPPEQYQGNADPRSDLYALAATLHHLLTNRDPRNHPPFTYPPARALNPQLSPEIERVLMHALNNDINQRYQSASMMQQDIDDILRQRFGISGNIDSYTLGTSGMMGAAGTYTANAPTAPSIANLPTHASPNSQPIAAGVSTTTPVQPLPPLPSGNMQTQQSSPSYPSYPPFGGSQAAQRKPLSRNGLILLLALISVFLIIGATVLLANNGHSSAGTAGTGTGIGITQVGNENIGISDGTFVFDATRADGQLKQQAATQLKQNPNSTSSAIALLSQAIDQDSSDAEAHIYAEDLRVVNSGQPYATFVVATMLTGSDAAIVGVGRDDLQGAYVAQKDFNDGAKLHGGVRVRLLIANAGSKQSNVTQVAQQIVQLAHTDKTFAGVMGWPYSGYSIDALKILGAANIPLVSPTASSDQLSGASPYFFRVAPSNKLQGIGGAKYAEQVLHGKNVALFYDQANSYTQSLSQDFAQQFKADGNTVVAEETYTVGKPDTIPAKLQDALKHNPDFIYFAGYASDVSALLVNLPPGNMPVMGGDALYELGGYASSARAGFTHLHFTTFAYPDEWEVQGYTNQKPAFFNEYPAAFDSSTHQGSPYGFSRADNDAMLAYDATVAVLTGYNNALSSGKTKPTPQDLQQGLRQINGNNSFQGVSGQIAFDNNGDPIDKTIVILSVDAQGHIQMEQKTLGKFLK